MPAAQTLDSPRKSWRWWINLSDRGGTSQILPPTLSRKREWHYDVCGQLVKCSHYVQYEHGHEATVRSQTSWMFFLQVSAHRCNSPFYSFILQTTILEAFELRWRRESLHSKSTRMMSSNNWTADETVFKDKNQFSMYQYIYFIMKNWFCHVHKLDQILKCFLMFRYFCSYMMWNWTRRLCCPTVLQRLEGVSLHI